MVKNPVIRVGCAGWCIPSPLAGGFPVDGTHLSRYAARLAVVEINSSFYRPHLPRTYAKWAAQVPAGFKFSVKFPKSVTHGSRLLNADATVVEFASQVGELGDALGAVLVQLPPSLAFDAELTSSFFSTMRDHLRVPIVCEPRHASWFDAEADDIWQRFAVSRVAADPARVPAAGVTAGGGPTRYWRLHGSPRVYYDAYDDASLAAWAGQIRAEARAGHECMVIFDNTAGGHAVRDALRLQELLGTASPGAAHIPVTDALPRQRKAVAMTVGSKR